MKPQAGYTINTVLAVDPGRDKCGLAVVTRETDCSRVLHKEVIATINALETIKNLASAYNPDVIIIGNGTTSAKLTSQIKELRAAVVEIVDEKYTTIEARKIYFNENPPRGIKKLIPTSLQTPNEPYDDYVAVLLAQRYLAGHSNY